MRTFVALVALALIAASPAAGRGPKVLRCTDGARCDADGTKDGTCTVSLCERTGCRCTEAGCCGARFCSAGGTPLAQTVLDLGGRGHVQERVAFGTTTVTVRCRRQPPPAPTPTPSPMPY